jgi:hypothetical protein
MVTHFQQERRAIGGAIQKRPARDARYYDLGTADEVDGLGRMRRRPCDPPPPATNDAVLRMSVKAAKRHADTVMEVTCNQAGTDNSGQTAGLRGRAQAWRFGRNRASLDARSERLPKGPPVGNCSQPFSCASLGGPFYRRLSLIRWTKGRGCECLTM